MTQVGVDVVRKGSEEEGDEQGADGAKHGTEVGMEEAWVLQRHSVGGSVRGDNHVRDGGQA